VPVISGNVSLYNETRGESIYPTPVTGMVGLIEDAAKHCTQGFKQEGDIVYLLGKNEADASGLSGSEYLEVIHGIVKGDLTIDLTLEKSVQRCCIELIAKGIINSAHDCSDGGLLVCLAECCIPNKLGFSSKDITINNRLDATLFGEAQSRIVISVPPKQAIKLDKIAVKWQVPITKLGTTGGTRLVIKGFVDVSLDDMEQAWRGGLTNCL